MPSWKKRVLLAAGAVLVAGAAMKVVSLAKGQRDAASSDAGGKSATGGASGTGAARTLSGGNLLPGDSKTPGGSPGSETPPASGSGSPQSPEFLDDWSPVLVKGSLALFVGFTIGFALRSFLRVSAIFAGLIFGSILLLNMGGYLTIEWGKAQADFDSFVAALRGQVPGIKGFVQGSVPSAGLAIAGLFTGFKKR